MSTCEFCGIVQGAFESEQLYEDDKVLAVLHLKPAVPGQILIFTKEHFPIIEQVPDFIIGHAFAVANKLSIAMFDVIGAQGSNMVVENGNAAGQTIPHFSITLLPRHENDGLNLQWQPKKISDDEMDILSQQIKEKSDLINSRQFQKESKQVVVAHTESIQEHKEKKKGSQEHLIRQLRR